MPIASINPATGEVIKTFSALSEAEIEKKVQLAVRVFKAEKQTPFAVRRNACARRPISWSAIRTNLRT